ncbi:hypothetical protein Alsa3_CDS0099 [Staphylococcus phage Alsa_3]|nr:hypothetical protein Alsa3_CDS0099 [Staphylococcus phage Alsa_3]WNM51223.1 hypothetical protein Alsa4_CDS0093 [Staphylococcus phage Alsa_4]
MAMIIRQTELHTMLINANKKYWEDNNLTEEEIRNLPTEIYRFTLEVNSSHRIKGTPLILEGEYIDITNLLYRSNFIPTTQTISTGVEKRGKTTERTQYYIKGIEVIGTISEEEYKDRKNKGVDVQ